MIRIPLLELSLLALPILAIFVLASIPPDRSHLGSGRVVAVSKHGITIEDCRGVVVLVIGQSDEVRNAKVGDERDISDAARF